MRYKRRRWGCGGRTNRSRVTWFMKQRLKPPQGSITPYSVKLNTDYASQCAPGGCSACLLVWRHTTTASREHHPSARPKGPARMPIRSLIIILLCFRHFSITFGTTKNSNALFLECLEVLRSAYLKLTSITNCVCVCSHVLHTRAM